MTSMSKTLVALAIASTAALAQSNSNQVEERFRAKYGRSTPATEAREASEKASTAYRETAPARKASPGDTWAESRHRAKLGRATPAEEKRQEAENGNTAYREVTAPVKDRWYDNYFERKYGRPAPKK